MKTILVPVDFSAATEAIIPAAITLAHAFAGELILLHVLAAPDDYRLYPVADHTAWEREKARSHRKIQRLVANVRNLGVTVSSKVRCGGPIEGILAQARESAANVIVMGSRGHAAIYDLLIGSTTSGVLKAAVCPVMLVPENKAKRQEARAVAVE